MYHCGCPARKRDRESHDRLAAPRDLSLPNRQVGRRPGDSVILSLCGVFASIRAERPTPGIPLAPPRDPLRSLPRTAARFLSVSERIGIKVKGSDKADSLRASAIGRHVEARSIGKPHELRVELSRCGRAPSLEFVERLTPRGADDSLAFVIVL